MMDWYECINGGEELYTCIDGPDIGKRLIKAGGKTIWKSDDLLCENELLNNNIINEPIAGNDRFFKERLVKRSRLVICGAGYVGEAVAALGKKIGFDVTVIDEREEFLKGAEESAGVAGLCMEFGEALESIVSDENTYFVIVTRGHSRDIACLDKTMKKEAAYIGMMGSKKRCQRAKDEMKARGYDAGKIHAPIGIDIGAETPEEIAVSVIGEIISVKNRCFKGEPWSDIIAGLKKNKDEGVVCVLATIVSKSGSAPRSVGTRMLIGDNGVNVGTIGGGYIESEVFKTAKKMLSDNEKSFVLKEYGTVSEEENTGCGGRVEIFFEKIA